MHNDIEGYLYILILSYLFIIYVCIYYMYIDFLLLYSIYRILICIYTSCATWTRQTIRFIGPHNSFAFFLFACIKGYEYTLLYWNIFLDRKSERDRRNTEPELDKCLQECYIIQVQKLRDFFFLFESINKFSNHRNIEILYNIKYQIISLLIIRIIILLILIQIYLFYF